MGLINRILVLGSHLRFITLLLALVASSTSGANASSSQTYNEAAWQALNKTPAIISNTITSAVEYKGRLYMTGDRLGAGSLRNQRLIAWDGDQWFAVPDPITLDMSDNLMMSSAVVHEGELVVSAILDRNFGDEIRSALYAWNGSAWRTLYEDSSMTATFARLHSTHAGLVVLSVSIPSFPLTGPIQMQTWLWDGTSLSNMPINGVPFGFSFATWQGQLYWAGNHQDTTASDSNAHYALLAWNGQAWKAVEHSKLTAISYSDNQVVVSGDDLVLAGSFSELNGVPVEKVARWDGSAWHQLSGLSDPYINDDWVLEIVETAQQVDDRLIILGRYVNTSSNETDYKLSFWNGQSVEPLSEGVSPKGLASLNFFWAHFQQQTLLFNVNEVGGTAVNSAAIWGNPGWKAFDGVQVKTVNALAQVNGRLAVAGLFSDGSHGVAWQEPSGWQQFATSNNSIDSLVEYQGNLVAAGKFTQIGGVSADSIALWNGTSWEAFAGGLPGASISKVFVFNDQVYAAGTGAPFDGDNSALLYWDGSNWVAPSTGGSTISLGSRIKAVVEFNGQLVLGGNISLVGGSLTSNTPLVTWDGATLSPFAPLHSSVFFAYYDWVSSLTVYDGKLIAATETFSAMPTPSMPYLAAWDGTSWNTFAEIVGNVVQVAVFDDKLMALVKSPQSNDNLQSDYELRSWDGQDWSGLTFDGYRLGFKWAKLMLAQDDLMVFASDFHGVGFTDWSETENAVYSPGIIGLQSVHATITFTGEGADALAPITTTRGTSITLPDLQRDHYTFLGWNTAADGSGMLYKDTMALPYGATTLYADWAPVLYRLTFVLHGTTFELSSHLPGASIAAPSFPTRTGYTFINWNAPVPTTMPAHNLTFTAQWQINTYTISFVMAGADAVAPLTLAFGAAVTLPIPEREGYEFLGWDVPAPVTMPANDLTLTAQWKIKAYTISFVMAGGDAIAPIAIDYGAAVEMPVAKRNGYRFLGWDLTVPATMPAEDLIFTARWEVNAQSSSSESSASSVQSSSVSSVQSSSVTSAPVSSQSSLPTGGGVPSSSSVSSMSSTPASVSSSSASSQSSSPDNGGINSSTATSSSQAAESSSSTGTQPVSSQASSSSVSQSSVSSSSARSGGGSGSSSLLLFAILGLCLVTRRSREVM